MTDSIDDVVRRPSQYWNEDGLVEIFVGLLALVPALLFGLATKIPGVPPIVLPFAWITVILLLKRALGVLKERVISPRTGYIVPAESGTVKIVSILVVFVSAVVYEIWGLFTHMDQIWVRAPGLLLALFLSAAFLWGWLQARQLHFLFLAGVPLFAEVWIFRSGLDLRNAIIWLLLAQGVALVFSGAVRLRSFLRANPGGNSPA